MIMPKLDWKFTEPNGSLMPEWAQAYMIQQVGLALMLIRDELVEIRKAMPVSPEEAERRRMDMEADMRDDEIRRLRRYGRDFANGVCLRLNRLFADESSRGRDVKSEPVARAIVTGFPLTSKQRVKFEEWWEMHFPSTPTPDTTQR